MLPLENFLPHLLSSWDYIFLKIHQVTVEQAGESLSLLYTYGNKLAQAIREQWWQNLYQRRRNLRGFPFVRSVCEPRLNELQREVPLWTNNARPPPLSTPRLPEKYIKGGCSGERFTVYPWHLIKARAFASPNTSERHRYRCSPTSDSRGLPWKPSGETIRQFGHRTGSKTHFLESNHGFLHRIQRVSVNRSAHALWGDPARLAPLGQTGDGVALSLHRPTLSRRAPSLRTSLPPLLHLHSRKCEMHGISESLKQKTQKQRN